MNKSIVTLLIVLLSNLGMAQDILMNKEEVYKVTEPTLKALEKFEKRPKKEKRKEKFLKEYDKLVEAYPIDMRSNGQSQLEENWEGRLNALNIFQYLGDKISATKASSALIKTNDYSSIIDSISQRASNTLYAQGKLVMEKEENEFSNMNAYHFFYRANLISPNYKDCKDLMGLSSAAGTKTVSFMPLKPFESITTNVSYNSEKGLQSLPNIYMKGGKDTHFFASLINEPLLNGAGSQLTNNDALSADWIVDIQWESLDMPSRFEETEYERSREIEENGVTKTVKADVTYNKKFVDMSGTMSIRVDSKISNSTILLKDITGYGTFTYVDVTYTGDKKALTKEDIYYQSQQDQPIQGNLSLSGNQYGFDGNQYGSNSSRYIFDSQSFERKTTGYLIRKFYDSIIYPQLVDDLGYLLNWNYPFLKKK